MNIKIAGSPWNPGYFYMFLQIMLSHVLRKNRHEYRFRLFYPR